MLAISETCSIPESEWSFTYARSGGPGGQNVNKVASKALLRWNLLVSESLSESVKQRFTALYPSYLTTTGEVLIVSQKYRDQDRNRDDCLAKLAAMIRRAAVVPKARKVTKPSKSAKRRRLADKKHNAERISARRAPKSVE